MPGRLNAIMFALCAPLVLASCLFVPGKFESTLAIHADRSFTFSYKGEVMAVDLENQMNKGVEDLAEEGENKNKAKADTNAGAKDKQALTAEEKAKQDEEYRKLAVELAREAGYRTVEYRGEGLFWVDYQVSGTLDHAFVFPYNPDAEMILPWIAVELRGKDLVRVKAPGYVPDGNKARAGMGAIPKRGEADSALTRLEGTFILTTDAELVSQNNEEGAVTVGKDKTVTWKTNTRSDDAPMASIRVRPLP